MIERILPAGVTNVKGVEGVKETAPKENVKEADNNTNFLKKTELFFLLLQNSNFLNIVY